MGWPSIFCRICLVKFLWYFLAVSHVSSFLPVTKNAQIIQIFQINLKKFSFTKKWGVIKRFALQTQKMHHNASLISPPIRVIWSFNERWCSDTHLQVCQNPCMLPNPFGLSVACGPIDNQTTANVGGYDHRPRRLLAHQYPLSEPDHSGDSTHLGSHKTSPSKTWCKSIMVTFCTG